MKTKSLRSKLLGSYAFCTAILLLVGIIGFVGVRMTSSNYAHVAEVNLPNTVALTTMRAGRADMVIAAVYLSGVHATAEAMARSKGLAGEAVKRFDAAVKHYEELPQTQGGEALWAEVKKQWDPFKDLTQRIIALSESGSKNDESIRDELIAKDFEKLRVSLRVGIQGLIDLQAKESATWVEKANSASGFAIILTLIAVILGGVVGMLFGVKISSSLTKTLNGIAETLSDNSKQVGGAAQSIAASSEQLSQSITEQAASLEETSSSIEEMTTMIKKNSDSANKAAEVSDTTRQSATRGREVVIQMLKAIDEINESNQQISEIVKVIAEIENKTKVINDIVFKTQLLSFNASVEAARAGAHGKGFAVVAEEVGKLAQLSGNAAGEISSMLSTSVHKVDGLVTNAKEKVKVGTDIAQQCGIVLEEIVANVGILSQMSKEIASASQEQAQGVEEVAKAMVQLDQVTQENAANSEVSASAAEELSVQGEALKNVVQVLVRTIQGGEEGQSVVMASTAHQNEPVTAFNASPHAKVLHIKNAQGRKTQGKSFHGSSGQLLRKAAGAEGNCAESVSETDPRFKDV